MKTVMLLAVFLKKFENVLKTTHFKNTTLELCTGIGNQTKNRS